MNQKNKRPHKIFLHPSKNIKLRDPPQQRFNIDIAAGKNHIDVFYKEAKCIFFRFNWKVDIRLV